MPIKDHVTGFSNPFRQYEGGSIPNWQYGGDAVLANDYLSLTPAAPGKIGHIWSTSARNLKAWEVEFDFHIGGAPTRGSGGGLAFWWTSEPANRGNIFGHTDTFKGLGIFFDTYESHEVVGDPGAPGATTVPKLEPYIVAMVNDGTPLGASLQDADMIAAKQVAVCFARYRNLPHVARARIAWANKVLRMWIDLEGANVFQPCLETVIDDVRMGIMPEEGYFGLSAATGGYGDAHVVYSTAVASLAPSSAPEQIATPHIAAATEPELDPTHAVRPEASDHETHVKLIPTEPHHHMHPAAGAGAGTDGAADGPMATDEEPAPQHNPVHLPPLQSETEQMAHMFAALEGQHEVRDLLGEVKEELSQMSLAHDAHRHELLSLLTPAIAELNALAAATPATGAGAAAAAAVAVAAPSLPPGAPAGAGAMAPAAPPPGFDGAALTAAIQLAINKLEAAHAAVAAPGGGSRKAAAAGADPAATIAALSEQVRLQGEAAVQTAHAASEARARVESKAAAIEAALSDHGRKVQDGLRSLREEIEGLRTLSRGSVEDVRHEAALVRKAVEAAQASGGSGGGTFALAVTAQALVVAALLFYRSVGGGGKGRHSHLP